ncbi:MAG: LacI family DNA-binding transcriptional regulator [Solirubrobacteraceae bacterium]
MPSTTITDVALAAGVSTATVSRVLNNQPQVDPRLATAVRKAAKDLGYRPSRVARSLRTRQSQVWALLLSDIRNPFFTDMVRGIEDVAFAAGFSLILCNAEEDPAKEASYLELAVAESVGGVILTPTTSSTDLSGLEEVGIPAVLADRTIEAAGTDSVVIDNAGGAQRAVGHLIDGGHDRIACITGPLEKTTGAARYAGYRAALQLAGLAVDESLVRVANFRESGGRQAMQELLAGETSPDAVFVANNLMTIGALHAIAEAGLRIPVEIAVIGFDEMSWATLLSPALTTVAQPTYDLGVETGRLLRSRIEGYAGAARTVTLSPSLRIRESSRAKLTTSVEPSRRAG